MQNTIELSAIAILPNRQRREFDDVKIQELSDSFVRLGQLQGIVLRRIGENYTLVAGENRMRAAQLTYEMGGSFRYGGVVCPPGHIGFVDIGDLDELTAFEAELDENIRRKDLTWQEHSAAVAKLDALRKMQAAAKQETHSIGDTAKEVYGSNTGYSHEKTRKELIVAQHLTNPAIAKAKTVDEAIKILKAEVRREENRQLAATIGASFTADSHEVINENCIRWLKACRENVFDVILTDPPYGMGAHSFGDAAGRLQTIDHQYDDSYENWRNLMEVWCPESFRVAKEQAHAYVFCDIDRFAELRELMQKAGWYVFRTPFTVYKTDSGRVPLPEHGPRRQSEWLLYAFKGKKPVNYIAGDVIPCQADANMLHGAQKPVALYQNLLQRSVRPGDSVLDCFAGSGTIIPAAHVLKCKATAIEMSPEYFALCVQRVKELGQLDGGLADLVKEQQA